MKIGILGYGKEGQSAEAYFRRKGDEVAVFDNFTSDDLAKINFDGFELLLRSPSVRPLPSSSPFAKITSSMTKYFFAHCPCPIIGVTGTKGKGTTCSFITDLLKNLGQKVRLVGNIGNPALDVLDQIQPQDVVVYEMSSFQLWDLEQSPQIAVVLGIEPDHLNVHADYNDYISAKANIAKHQTADDICIYFAPNPDSGKIAAESKGQKIPYPIAKGSKQRELLDELLPHLAIPGQHNRNNAEAALLAVSSYYQMPLMDFLQQHREKIVQTLENFQGLPHRLQFLRELGGIKYYDDNFSTTLTSLEVALQAFPEQKIVLIVGGRDKTNGEDLPKIVELIKKQKVAQVILLGESGRELEKLFATDKNAGASKDKNAGTSNGRAINDSTNQASNSGANNVSTQLAASLPEAVQLARKSAEELGLGTIVLMSPAAASFDMFANVYARGAEYQKLIQELK